MRYWLCLEPSLMSTTRMDLGTLVSQSDKLMILTRSRVVANLSSLILD